MNPVADSPDFVEMENVSIARGNSIVLHDLSFRIGAREHVAILGPNGCGKSTLIRALSSQAYPVAGRGARLRLFGRERWDVNELRSHLGIVASDFPGDRVFRTSGRDAVLSGFFSSATLWPNLHPTLQMEARAADLLRLLEIGGLSGKALGQMSAGELKRIQIARALVHCPQMLLLDEPANALDMKAHHDLTQMLRRLSRQGIGLVLVTHHVSDILPEIDRILMLRQGRIVADGPKRDLLTASHLQHLFGLKIELVERDGFFHAWR